LQQQKGYSKLISLDSVPKDDERKNDRKATQPFLLLKNVAASSFCINI